MNSDIERAIKQATVRNRNDALVALVRCAKEYNPDDESDLVYHIEALHECIERILVTHPHLEISNV